MARDIKVAILGDARDFSRAVAAADADASRFGATTRRMGTAAKVALASAGVAAFQFGKSSVNAFVEAEKSQAALADAFDRFPNLAGSSVAALSKINDELQRKTRFDDDALASGQAVIAQFGLTGKQVEAITPLIADYAAKTGKDIPTAATTLGKAFMGNTRALKEIGISYKMTGDKAKDMAAIQKLVNEKVGGFATKEGKTAAGQAAILRNQFEELQEKVGAKLVPVLQKLADKLLAFGDWLGRHKPVLVAFGVVVGVGLVAAFVAWAASAAAAAVATLAAVAPILLIGAVIAALAAGVIYAYTHWDWFRNAVDKVASFVTGTLWPALKNVASWITGTLIPTVGNIIAKFGEWLSKVKDVVAGILGKFGELLMGAKGAVDGVIQFFVGLVGYFSRLPGTIGRWAKDAWESLKNGLAAAADWIIRKINAIIGPVRTLLSMLDRVSEWGGGIPSFKSFETRYNGGQNPDSHAQGGVISGAFNQPRLILAHGGERVLTRGEQLRQPTGATAQTIVVQIGDEVLARVIANASATGARRGIG